MADLPPHDKSNSDPAASRLTANRRSPPSTPRWVKVSATIVIALVVLFVIVHLAGGGFRGHAPLIQSWMQQQ